MTRHKLSRPRTVLTLFAVLDWTAGVSNVCYVVRQPACSAEPYGA